MEKKQAPINLSYPVDLDQSEDTFKTRIGKLEIDGKTIKVHMSIQETRPLFVTVDTVLQEHTFKEEPAATKTAYSFTDADENGVARYIYAAKIKSYLTNTYMEIYYDKKYQDILLVPDLSYAKFCIDKSTYNVWCYRIGGGVKMTDLFNQNDISLPVEDNETRMYLPETKDTINPVTHLTAIPGLESADYTADTNSFEEMLNDAINLKRYHRQMRNIIKLGTVTEVFKENTNLPIYLLKQKGPRVFKFKYIGKTKLPPDTVLYISLDF